MTDRIDISDNWILRRFGYADSGHVKAIRDEAIRQERGRCVKIADDYAKSGRFGTYKRIYATYIADKIRAGKEPTK